jgi:hypothetical protein
MTIWCILCSFGNFFPVLVSCTKKNLATLLAAALNIGLAKRRGLAKAFLAYAEHGAINRRRHSVQFTIICRKLQPRFHTVEVILYR